MAFALLILHGCVDSPTYQPCCEYESAFPESGDPVCRGIDEEGDYQEWDVLGLCDEEGWFCTVDTGGAEPEEVPICPKIDEVRCNTSCRGVFCGSFDFDPRPEPSAIPEGESHRFSHDKNDVEIEGTGDPVGLWNAKCIVEDLTEDFQRKLENSDDIVMNIFRFGVGDSFQDFEDAQYYFPITDRACDINPNGYVDRYIIYAIPNSKGSGVSQLCELSGAGVPPGWPDEYVCSAESSIRSYSYFDCASRCALDEYGYESEIDPFNPYLSINGFNRVGNPFVYGPMVSYDYGDANISLDTSTIYRESVRASNYMSLMDKYLTGTVLYGATFGIPRVSKDGEHDDPMLTYIAGYGPVYDGDWSGDFIPQLKNEYIPEHADYTEEIETGYEFDNEYVYTLFWKNNYAKTVFITEEHNAHAVYPWLLSHHSVYNRQFEEGHYLMNGSWAPGAEFECTSSSDCISGYCNMFDYQRGACQTIDGKDVVCDCVQESGDVICLGTAAQTVESWDDPFNSDVNAPKVLAASVDFGGETDHGGEGENLASLPAIGAVKSVEFLDKDEAPIGDLVGEIPLFVMSLGGQGESFTAHDGVNRIAPDYKSLSWKGLYDAGKGMQEYVRMQTLLDLCSALPEDWVSGAYWWFKDTRKAEYDDGVERDYDYYYVTCCGPLSSCGWVQDDEPGDYDGEAVDTNNDTMNDSTYYVRQSPQAGWHATTFVENCMEGYMEHVSVCYSTDAADDHLRGHTGWTFGDGGEISQELKANGEGTICEYIHDLKKDKEQLITGYQWRGGGLLPSGTEDDMESEAQSFIVIEPHWVEDEELGGIWAFGNCILNPNGDDLELRKYGVCESCGYLTMAKQELVALDEDADDPGYEWDEDCNEDSEPKRCSFAHGRTYGNTYCPDMVVSTPHNSDSSFGMFNILDEEPELNFNYIEPYGMGGAITYDFGSFVWSNNDDVDLCEYPNGYRVTDDHGNDEENSNAQRALPYTLPNAWYVNSKLESMMKRNIQPVLFATDNDLWALDYASPYDPDEDDNWFKDGANLLLRFDEDDGKLKWSTSELMRSMYLDKNYLFDFYAWHDEDTQPGYYSTIGSFLSNVVINEGGLVLVTDNYPSYCLANPSRCKLSECGSDCYDGINYLPRIYDRAKATRLMCPNCMVAVGIGYEPVYYEPVGFPPTSFKTVTNPYPGTFNMEEQLKEISSAFLYRYESGHSKEGQAVGDMDIITPCVEDAGALPGSVVTCSMDMMDSIDVIAMNLQLQDGDDYCSITDETGRFAAILGNLTTLGRVSLQRFGKPIIISDFVINRSGTCWDDDSAGRLMSYLALNAREFVRSGYGGIIYGDWESPYYDYTAVRYTSRYDVAGYRGDFFNGTFAAARLFAGHSTKVYYSELIVKEGEGPGDAVCPCEPCGPGDSPSICNGAFNGDTSLGTCDGYTPGESAKWAEECLTDSVCEFITPTDPGTVECVVTYDDGSFEDISLSIADVAASPAIYRDVIASIETDSGKPVCVDAGSSAIAYKLNEFGGYTSLPMVFSKTGDPEIICDTSDAMDDVFCGHAPPISTYRLSCRLEG